MMSLYSRFNDLGLASYLIRMDHPLHLRLYMVPLVLGFRQNNIHCQLYQPVGVRHEVNRFSVKHRLLLFLDAMPPSEGRLRDL